MRVEGASPLGAPPVSWAPCCSTDVLLPPIYTFVPPSDQIRSQKPNSTTATFCIREIPSWGLFRSSAGGGIYHGGLLHQHHSLSDEMWVVYLRPSGPLLVARWLLLSFWISIQCSPPLSWRSIRCNLLFCGVFVETDELWVYDPTYLWIIFESSLNSFMYDWVIFASLFELSVWFGQLDW